jgi:pimeloyl-ACP methyl ester carboxylesterase
MLEVIQSLLVTLSAAIVLASSLAAPTPQSRPVIKVAQIGHGIALHYVDEGHGQAVIFVHGSISFGGYWSDQLPHFAQRYRAIAYSRRYNYPNVNPATPGYSAVTDADDLARFIQTLHLHNVIVVGHSYGALTALFFQVRHPGLAKALVLAEPPAVSLLNNLSGPQHAVGKAAFDDIQRRMVVPMTAAFKAGRSEEGVADFIDYVYDKPHEWESMSAESRKQTMQNAHEWDVMMTSGTLFPVITPEDVRGIHVPVLLLTGDKTYPFLTMIDDELTRLLPNYQNVVVSNAGHQMWYQAPELCRDVVETFMRWTATRAVPRV